MARSSTTESSAKDDVETSKHRSLGTPDRAHEDGVGPHDFQYVGELGNTRIETLHLPLHDGTIRTIQVYRGVNVGTHPELRAPTLAGALHRFDTGEELALSFVFHDPAAKKLAVVVPESLRHEALRERARFLAKLADDTVYTIPPYVAEGKTVIGLGELLVYLESGERDAMTDLVAALRSELGERDAHRAQLEAALAERARLLSEREGELSAARTAVEALRAERATDDAAHVARLDERERSISAREAESEVSTRALAERTERLESREREVAIREEELESRLAGLRVREAEARRIERAAAPIPLDTFSTRAFMNAEAEARRDAEEEELVEEIDDVDVLPGTSPGVVGTATPSSAASFAATPFATSSGEPLADDALAGNLLLDDADEDVVEDLDDLAELEEVTGAGVNPLRAEDAAERGPVHAHDAPPPTFFEHASCEMAAKAGEPAQLFVRLDPPTEATFGQAGFELFVQYLDVEGYPVVVLSLVGRSAGGPVVRRTALDPLAEDDRAVLEALRRRFAAKVSCHSIDGRFLRTAELEGERRENVALVLERCVHVKGEPRIDGDTAMERALAAPPPLWDASHPFDDEASLAESARDAKDALDRLTNWATADRLDHALLVLSIPTERVHGTLRRALEDAKRFGLYPPASLVDVAIELRVARDAATLLVDCLRAFREVSASPDRGGLGPVEVVDNFRRLLAAASEHELTGDAALEASLVELRDAAGNDVAAPDVSSLPGFAVTALLELLVHPTLRAEAAIELCRREDPTVLPAVVEAVRKMSRDEVVRVVPKLLVFGEAAGDALVDGLTAKKTFVRQASALALGRLRLRRAVAPLVHLLEEEPSDGWQEVARILAEFGQGSLRAVVRAARESRSDGARMAYTLAHLAEAGLEEPIRKLEADSDARVARMARDALAARSAARTHRLAVVGDGRPAPDDALRAFSRRFYEELGGAHRPEPSAVLLEPATPLA